MNWDRKFTYHTREDLKKYYPWRNKIIIEGFDKLAKIDSWYEFSIMTKEKRWRFDITAGWYNDEMFDIIRRIECTTEETCIECWAPWKMRDTWWVKPLCSKCFRAYNKKCKEIALSRQKENV